MAIGGGGHGEAPRHGVVPSTTGHGTHRSPGAGEASRGGILAWPHGPRIPAGPASPILEGLTDVFAAIWAVPYCGRDIIESHPGQGKGIQ
jgi:hypothetical protein